MIFWAGGMVWRKRDALRAKLEAAEKREREVEAIVDRAGAHVYKPRRSLDEPQVPYTLAERVEAAARLSQMYLSNARADERRKIAGEIVWPLLKWARAELDAIDHNPFVRLPEVKPGERHGYAAMKRDDLRALVAMAERFVSEHGGGE